MSRVHKFSSSKLAVEACNHSIDLTPGDILHVPNESAVLLFSGWPLVIAGTPAHGHPMSSQNVEDISTFLSGSGVSKPSALLAAQYALDRGYPLLPWTTAYLRGTFDLFDLSHKNAKTEIVESRGDSFGFRIMLHVAPSLDSPMDTLHHVSLFEHYDPAARLATLIDKRGLLDLSQWVWTPSLAANWACFQKPSKAVTQHTFYQPSF